VPTGCTLSGVVDEQLPIPCAALQIDNISQCVATFQIRKDDPGQCFCHSSCPSPEQQQQQNEENRVAAKKAAEQRQKELEVVIEKRFQGEFAPTALGVSLDDLKVCKSCDPRFVRACVHICMCAL